MWRRSRSSRRGAPLLVAAMLAGAAGASPAQSPATAGDLLVSEQGPGGTPGAVVRIDPVTGVQTKLPIAGAVLTRPIGIDRTPGGDLLVADNADNSATAATIYRLDASGQATPVASGSALSQLTGLVVDPGGDVFFARHDPPAILHLDLSTGVVDVVSTGGFLHTPWDLAVEADGQLAVADIDGGVLRVDPASGGQTRVRAPDGMLFNFRGITVALDGALIVSGETTTPGGPVGAVARVDPVTGVRTTITQGQYLRFPFAVRIEADGQLSVIEEGSAATLPAVVRVDPATGVQSVLSAVGELQAPVGLTVVRVAVVEVEVDILPASARNPLHPQRDGVLPVAVLSAADLDATFVDPASVRFGATGTEAPAERFSDEDVDGDGDLDLLLHFRVRQTGLVCGDTVGQLTGRTFAGRRVEGSDVLQTVGCN